MKVLLVSPKMDNPNGGIAIWTDTYLNNCKDVGIDCNLLNIAPMGKRAENGNAKRNFLVEAKRSNRIFRDLGKLLKESKYDVAHLNTSCGTFGIIRDYLIAKKIKKHDANIKLLVHFHCDIPVQIANPISKRYLRKLIKLSEGNLVLCDNSKNYLKNEFNFESKKIPNFMDEALLNEKKAISPKIRNALFIGRVCEAKGAFEIFEIAKSFPEIIFEFAGAYSDEIEKMKLPSNVCMLGMLSHENVLNKLDEADLFLFPSHSEGFSIALMEAMARGVPTIATDVGANRDMLENQGGIIVAMSDVDSMKQAMNDIADETVRRKMSEWNICKVKNNYVTKQVMAQLSWCYK